MFSFLMAIGNGLFAQNCTSYPIHYTQSGFLCGDGNEGTICFNTHPGFWIGGECFEYHFEITFPTPAIEYEFLGQFPSMQVLSETPAETTLAFKHVGSALTPECITVTVLDPDVEFVVNIVSDDDPNVIANSTTFGIEQGTVIGNSSSDITLLSEAIENDDLLPAEEAIDVGQIVTINGTLIIDNEGLNDLGLYTLGYPTIGTNQTGLLNNIYMAEGAKIEIPDNSILEIVRGGIRGCEENWDRIEVQSGGRMNVIRASIADANVGTEIQDGGALTIADGAGYTRNDIGIGSFGEDLKNIQLDIFGSQLSIASFFQNRQGMHFENVNSIFIDGFTIVSEHEEGVYLENTNLTSNSLFINHCTNSGVLIEEPSNLFSMTNSRIDNCNRFGIFTNGTNQFLINDIQFFTNGTAIRRITDVPNEMTNIVNSDFRTSGTDISGSLLPSQGVINNNQFSIFEFNQSQTNIFLSGIGQADNIHNWTISNNPIMRAQRSNIRFNNIFGARVRSNEDIVSDNYNITISGGSNNNFFNNRATAPDRSFFMQSSAMPLILCNRFTAENSLIFHNNNGGAWIRGNEIHSTADGDGFNLTYGSISNTFAQTSPQNFHGNKFDISNSNNPVAKNFETDVDFVDFSVYRVGQPIPNQGTEIYPYFESVSANWFTSLNNANYECPPGPPPIVTPTIERLSASVRTNIKLLDNEIEDIYGEEIKYITELKLLRQLRELDDLTILTAIEEGWLNTLEETSKGALLDIEDALSTAMKHTETDIVIVEQLRKELIEQIEELNAIEWYEMVNYEIVIDEVKKAQREDLKTQIEGTLLVLETMSTAQNAILQAQLPVLTALNNNVLYENIAPAENLVTVNDLLFKRLNSNFTEFTASEIQTLNSIANQCIGKGGEAVLTARSLLLEVTHEAVEYNDECLTAINNEQFVSNEYNNETSAIFVSPNPVDNLLTITLPIEKAYTQLEVKDALGRVVEKITVEAYQTQIELNTIHLQNGLYVIVPINHANQSTKFIVAH